MKSPEPGAAILIAASSGRALAAAARRSGYRPLVADFFDDADTRVLAQANRRVAGGLAEGFARDALFNALEALAEGEAPAGFVYGAGFEDRTELLEDISERWPLLGNAPDVVRRVKDPVELATLCARLGIPHPQISLDRPDDPRGWLAKSVGGSGGSHVAPAETWPFADEAPAGGPGAIYFQEFAKGKPVSLLFVADGKQAQALGTSRQWPAPAPGEPFRFGGSLRPAGLSPSIDAALADAAALIVAACGLSGLNSIDFLVDAEDFSLIEINPRPGATLDIFEDAGGWLFDAHLDGCLKCLPTRPLEFGGAQAAGIAYVRRAIPCLPALNWPDWTADRQRPQTGLRPHDPLCTVKASAGDPASARLLMDGRISFILDTAEQIMGTGGTF